MHASIGPLSHDQSACTTLFSRRIGTASLFTMGTIKFKMSGLSHVDYSLNVSGTYKC